MRIEIAAMAAVRRAAALLGISLSLSTAAIGANGRLVDQDARPVAGAWVVATREECRGLAHCQTYCVEVKVSKTDERGNFAFGSGLRSLDAYMLTGHRDGLLPTYQHVGTSHVKLIMVRGRQDERFSKMDAVSARIAHLALTASHMACFTAPREERVELVPVYQAMFREANAIATSPEHHKVARQICDWMYRAQQRDSDPRYPPEAARAHRERYLQSVEPACNAPLDDAKERLILAALEKDDPAAIRAARGEGFDFNRRLDGRNPPIVVAAMKGSAQMVAELAAAGAKADETGADGRTALDRIVTGYYGPRARRLAVVGALLDAGADPNRPDIWGLPPLLRIAAENPGDAQMFALLIARGARVDEAVACAGCSERGQTVLHRIVDPALARIAVERGANVNARDSLEATPLMNANSPEIMQMLLGHGADPNAGNPGQWTALMYTLQRYESNSKELKPRYRNMAEMLVRAGARLDTKNQHGLDAFHYTRDEALKERLRTLAAKP